MSVDNEKLELRRLDLDEKKAEQEYQLRLREIGLKEAEDRRSRWSSPLVLSIIAAAIAAAGNGYISWLNGANQLAIESTRNASQRAIEQEKAEAARILEATKSSSPKDAASKLKFLIEVGLVADPNRQAAVEAYISEEEQKTLLSATNKPSNPSSFSKGPSALPRRPLREEPKAPALPPFREEPTAPQQLPSATVPQQLPPPTLPTPREELPVPPPKEEPIFERYESGWLGGGHDQVTQCGIARSVVVQKHPGKSILLKSSSEQSKKDILGRVEYQYSCVFEVK